MPCYAKLPFSITITFLFVIYRANSVNSENNKCQGSCETSNFSSPLPFPFGFTPGCPIQLNCNSTGVGIGEFLVLNITSKDIIIDLHAKCYRPLASLAVLFGENYALSVDNTLLLQNCSNPLPGPCEIRPMFLERSFQAGPCAARSDNISCFSSGGDGVRLLSFEEVNKTQCRFLFSSTAIVVDPARNSAVSVDLERVKLEWWVKDCNCDPNASHTDVKNGNKTVGCKCFCKEGFEGDGFKEGGGCRRVPSCNASKYISGKCGGTTRVGVLVGGLVGGALLMGIVALVCFYLRRRSNNINKQMSAKRLLSEAAGNSSIPCYAYREIERATNGFCDKQRLGTGAYGTVYAGKLHSDNWVAIKRFRYRDPDSIDQVMNEIKLLSSVSHPNLVRLLGCCMEEGEPMLVYEFMPNGTLSQYLQRERGSGLPWTVRLTIAAETAKAIAYLHSVNPPIFHRDIKSSNILLDYNYRSKVADFGLSRLGMAESSHISTAPQGTPGYLDPQYHQYFHLSDKSDVYSFGVVLVEIIFERRLRLGGPLLKQNIATMVLESPFYGQRRPMLQRGAKLLCVSDLLLLGRATIEEARSLLYWLDSEAGFGKMGVCGLSMGGVHAAMVGSLHPTPVATLPFLSPHSAVVAFCEGILKHATAWEALREDLAAKEAAMTLEEVRERMRNVLSLTDVTRFPIPKNPNAIIFVAATDDGYIPKHSVLELQKAWPGSEVRWVTGGHVSSFLLHNNEFRKAIVDGLNRLEWKESSL